MEIIVKDIAFDSPEQKASLALRFRVLREPLGLTFTKEELAADFSDFHIAANVGDLLVGTLLLRPDLDNSAMKMRQVAVDFDWQQKGIGKVMVKFSEGFARSKDFKKMELHARSTAIPFYLSLHYNLVGEPFNEVGIPHQKMFKNL